MHTNNYIYMKKHSIKTHKIRIGDISIAYHLKESVVSNSPVILFLHGFPFNKNMWRPQLEALDDNITGIAVDIRGHGLSTAGHGFFSIDCFAKDLLAFIKKLNIEKAILCGISMGGYIALRAQELFPEYISGLILCDTHSKADNNLMKVKRFDSIQALLLHGRRPFAMGFVQNVFGQKALRESSSAIDLIKSSIRRNNLNNICSTLLALASRTDTTDTLQHIDVPTLLIRGAEDKITAKADMQEMEKKIKNAIYIEINEAGHLPNLEAPDEFNKLVQNFIQENITTD